MRYDKKSLNFNLMTTTEAASYLHMSRQRLGVLVKENKIVPIKKFPQGMIFLRSDIYDYKNKNKQMHREVIFSEFNGITRQSIEFYKQYIYQLDEIQYIFICFDDFDAIIRDFYEEDNFFFSETLRGIKVPSLVIRDINGKEIWLSGCKCGYGGTGPRGTIDILTDLMNKNLISLSVNSSELKDIIHTYRMIEIFFDRDSDHSEFVFKESGRAEPYDFKGPLESSIYMKNSVPVLLQKNKAMTDNEEMFFNVFRDFVPEPIQIMIYKDKRAAREDGYVLNDDVLSKRVGPFQLIIKDRSGRELWIQASLSKDIPIEKQTNIHNILSECGFEIKNEESTNAIVKWMNIGYRIISGSNNEIAGPIILTKIDE